MRQLLLHKASSIGQVHLERSRLSLENIPVMNCARFDCLGQPAVFTWNACEATFSSGRPYLPMNRWRWRRSMWFLAVTYNRPSLQKSCTIHDLDDIVLFFLPLPSVRLLLLRRRDKNNFVLHSANERIALNEPELHRLLWISGTSVFVVTPEVKRRRSSVWMKGSFVEVEKSTAGAVPFVQFSNATRDKCIEAFSPEYSGTRCDDLVLYSVADSIWSYRRVDAILQVLQKSLITAEEEISDECAHRFSNVTLCPKCLTDDTVEYCRWGDPINFPLMSVRPPAWLPSRFCSYSIVSGTHASSHPSVVWRISRRNGKRT